MFWEERRGAKREHTKKGAWAAFIISIALHLGIVTRLTGLPIREGIEMGGHAMFVIR